MGAAKILTFIMAIMWNLYYCDHDDEAVQATITLFLGVGLGLRCWAGHGHGRGSERRIRKRDEGVVGIREAISWREAGGGGRGRCTGEAT